MGRRRALLVILATSVVFGCDTDDGSATPDDEGVGLDGRVDRDGAVGQQDGAVPDADPGDDPDQSVAPDPDAEPDAGGAPADPCELGCAVLDDCGRCVTDAVGECLGIADCAADCREDPAGAARSACLEALDACDDDAVDACLDAAPIEDDCQAGCASLDGCGFCLSGEDDECLDIDACAEQCRADGGALGPCLVEVACDEDGIDACIADPDGCLEICDALDVCEACLPEDEACAEDCVAACAARDDAAEVLDCVGAVEMCDADALDACLAEAPADECQQGCAALDDCGWCVTGDDGECLEVAGCAEYCRDGLEELGPCLLATECDEDAIDECLGLEPDDACGELCAALDGCEACFAEGDACAEDCAAACEAADDPGVLRDCVVAVEMCDADALAVCFDPPPPADDCEAGCAVLDDCGWCVTGPDDECLDIAGCADHCRDGLEALGLCLLDAECDEMAIDACLELEPDDACGELCAALDGCEACFADGEACAEDCAAACAAADDPGALRDCVVAVEMCDADAVAACFDAGPVDPPPMDDCEAGCLALDACEWCVTGPDDECLDVAGCAEYCRDGLEALGPCLLATECEEAAIDACLALEPVDPPPANPCLDGCTAYDACELCFVDADDECLTVEACAAECEANGEAEQLACVAEVVECDEAAFDACFEVEPPPPVDDCEAGCASIDGCGWCINEDDQCLDVAACAARCRELEGDLGPCLVAAACDGPAVDVCLEVLEPNRCEVLCDALDACAGCIPDGDGCAADCVAACEARDDVEALTACVEGAEMCDLAPCFQPPEVDVCEAGCQHYDACGFCFLNANDNCIPPDNCARQCRNRDEQDILGCILAVDDCDEDALNACLE